MIKLVSGEFGKTKRVVVRGEARLAEKMPQELLKVVGEVNYIFKSFKIIGIRPNDLESMVYEAEFTNDFNDRPLKQIKL